MKPFGIALLQNDTTTIRALCSALCHYFHSIHATTNISELRHLIAKHRIFIAIVDIELASLSEIDLLRRDFASLCIVCTHRIADEEMWTAALGIGAADMCLSRDTSGIVTAALRNTDVFPHPAAA